MRHDLAFVCGSVIRAGEVVEVVEVFRVNGGREFRLRVKWRGRLWQVTEEDVRCS